jgi:hypothetical protein
MTHNTRAGCLIVAVLVTVPFKAATVIATLGAPANAAQRTNDSKKPSVALKATPPLGFAPLKVRVIVDIKGGADDYEDFYCASVEWDWADGTTSGTSEDCDPYEPGKSAIQRRFTSDHTFREGGDYDVAFRLKQKSRIVSLAKGTVRVKSGIHEDAFDQ